MHPSLQKSLYEIVQFVRDCTNKDQKINYFSDVGVHHHNSVAGRESDPYGNLMGLYNDATPSPTLAQWGMTGLNNQPRNPPKTMAPHIQRECQTGVPLPCIKREREKERSAWAASNNAPNQDPPTKETQEIHDG